MNLFGGSFVCMADMSVKKSGWYKATAMGEVIRGPGFNLIFIKDVPLCFFINVYKHCYNMAVFSLCKNISAKL